MNRVLIITIDAEDGSVSYDHDGMSIFEAQNLCYFIGQALAYSCAQQAMTLTSADDAEADDL